MKWPKNPLMLVSIILSLFVFTACSQLQRSQESGYNNARKYSPTKRSSKTVNGDMQETEPERVSQKSQLKKLENGLNVRKEIEQYSKALPWFYSDQERIEFLTLPDFEARAKWMTSLNFNGRSSLVLSEMKDLVEAKDIAVGMPMALVKDSWGNPDGIEVSGNPQFKNERWKYNRYVSSPDGYKAEKKSVYFEGGKVVGWEIE